MINKAIEEKQEEILIQRWIPYQSEISFKEFKANLVKVQEVQKDYRTSKEILNRVENILKAALGGDDL